MPEVTTEHQRSWLLVASAFAVLLLLIAAAGLQTFRYTTRTGGEIERIQRDQEESGRILNELRSQTYSVAIELRDYLLATPANSAVAKQRLIDLQQSMGDNAERVRAEFGNQANAAVQRLQQALDRYRQSMAPAFAWTPAQRQEQGTLFLRNNVVPNRAAVLETTNEIEAVRTISLQKEREELVLARRAFRYELLVGLLLLLSFATAVATATTLRLRASELRAYNLQLQTEQDRQILRELSQKLVQAQEDERRSISRELHDQIGQMLTAIQMQFSKIEVSQESPSEKAQHLKDGKALVDRTVRAVRDMAMGLRPSILDDLGLVPALEWQAREFTRRSGIRVNLTVEGELESLSEAQATCLYRVVQEALTNCGRHANATQVSLTVHGGQDCLSLSVRDDGCGFDPRHLKSRGLGLLGMEERVRELGGKLDIVSQVGTGTLITAEIPAHRFEMSAHGVHA